MYTGFKKSLEKQLFKNDHRALILGTGGASLAVGYCLDKLGIEYKKVSRTSKTGVITYENLSEEDIKETQIIINCTPLGTSPNITSNRLFHTTPFLINTICMI